MSFFLVFLAVTLLGATLWAGVGGRRGILRGVRRPTGSSAGPEARPDEPAGRQPGMGLLYGGFTQPPANLPPVLLPADPAAADVDQVRFSLALRGYRMDQVDQVLDELRDLLAARDAELVRLRARCDGTAPEERPEAGA